MPRIKVVRGPNKNLTGNIFGVEFKDGVSVDNLPLREALRFSSVVSIVDAETGKPISHVTREHQMRKMGRVAAEQQVASEVDQDSELEDSESATKASEDQATVTDTAAPPAEPTQADVEQLWGFTREDLEKIADEGGIDRLREFADKREVRSRSIQGLIEGLMAKKEAHNPSKSEE